MTAAALVLATLPAPAGGNGGVAAGVIGGLAVGTILGAAAAQPRYYAAGAGVRRTAAGTVLLLDPRRAGLGRLSRRLGAPARAGLRLSATRTSATEFQRPRVLRGRFLFGVARGVYSRANFDHGQRHAERRHQKGRARLFGRARHLDHPEVAADHLWLRGRDLHGRSRPGRGAGAGAREGAAARHQAGNIFIEDLREEFVRDYVFPMFRANALYEGMYLLGTSIARPLIAKKQIEIAHKVGADAVCHGATGKGNDQVRFELTYYALDPSIKIIAPWREWSFKGRDDLLEFAREHQIPIAKDKEGEAPFSVDANLLHSSSEGKVLEDPAKEAPPVVYQRTISPMEAPDKATEVRIGFDKGDAVSLDGKTLSPAALLTQLNELGKANGIGRIDLVENRFVGMKSRGVYETPGGTILLAAHRAIESITLDRGAAHLKDEMMPRYAELIYNGFWFTPEREMLQALIDKSQEHVEGEVRLKLYKGNVLMAGRESAKSLYSSTLVTFEDDKGAYDQKDAEGFIRLNALRLRTLGMRRKKIREVTARPRSAAGPLGASTKSLRMGRPRNAEFVRQDRADDRLGAARRRAVGDRLLSAGTFLLAGILSAVF